MRHKTEKISFRISSEDLTVIEKKAKRANMSVSEFVRQAALDKNIIVIDELKDFMKGQAAMNRNLNQLVILSHQGKITFANLDNVRNELLRINENLNLIMEKRGR